MATLGSVIGRGTLAARPAAASAGRLWFATDGSGTLYRDNGSSWDSVEGAGGLADQGSFTYLDATEAAAPSTPATGKVRIYAKSDGRVYSKDDAGIEYGPFDAAGGGGTGERHAWDNATTYPLHASGDEFDHLSYAALTGVWTARNVADAEVWCPGGGAVDVEFNAQGDWLHIAIPSGDWEAVLQFQAPRGTEQNMFGLGVFDGSGNGLSCTPNYDGTGYMWSLSGYNYAVTGPSLTGFGLYDNRLAWLILRKNGTAYSMRWSRDGSTFSAYTATLTPGTTPTRFGIGRAYTADLSQPIRLHRLNFYSGTFVP